MTDAEKLTCAYKDCDRPRRVRDICKIHYDRERGDGRGRRDDTVLRTRTRNRATRDLIAAHREEFDALMEKAAIAVKKEQEQLEAAAKKAGVPLDRAVRLRPGPLGEGQTLDDRIKGLDR